VIAPRVAVISDTVDNVDGVAIGLRRLVAAANRAGHAMSLVGPAIGPHPEDHEDHNDEVVRIRSALNASLPIYPEYVWSVPELPELVRYLARSADLIQLATPGPMGIAGLIAGRMLGLPIIAQYHTEVAEYAARMTRLPFLRDLVAPIVGWFYQQAEVCLAPSRTVGERLVALGVAADRVCQIQRGVDLALFDPARRDRAALARHGVGPGPVALYVGRLSREKNLKTLAAAWQLVRAARPDAQLLVVGDGPYARKLAGNGIIRAGALFEQELAQVFASADLFVFPSETETFGNVVVEAAASGLPAVVAAAGASHEHVIPGVTGEVIDGRDRAAWARTIIGLLDASERRAGMGAAARAHAARYDLARAVDATWEIYTTVLKSKIGKVAS
jgi:glycosyltransferase involved in cell wall biosynthesis